MKIKHVLASSVAFATSALITFAHAQTGMGGMDMKSDKGMKGMDLKSDGKAKAQEHHGSGTVTKVDPGKSSVTIAHGPVQTMNWPAMTMTFKAKDKKMLDKVKQGDKVEFTFTQSGKDYVISQIR